VLTAGPTLGRLTLGTIASFSLTLATLSVLPPIIKMAITDESCDTSGHHDNGTQLSNDHAPLGKFARPWVYKGYLIAPAR
jgi:hypothetical protein